MILRRPLERLFPLVVLLLAACPAELRIESPDERLEGGSDTASAVSVVVDTVYRPMPIDSVAASFAWLVERPSPRMPSARPYPSTAEEAVRQFLRALGQTGSTSRGTIGVGDIGYERAFTYVHPAVRGRRTWRGWAASLAGIVRVGVVRLEAVPDDSTRVFAELSVLRELDGQALVGLYYGHFSVAPGDNGWQLTGARLASEDWAAPLGGYLPWRYDRAGAARMWATEDPAYALHLTRLASGEWVPLARPTPVAHLRFGLPDLR